MCDGGRRKCYRCGEEKGLECFSWRNRSKGRRDSFCRPCRSAYGREHYEKNKARYIQQAKERKRRTAAQRLEYLIEYFADHPCVDCGERDPLVLEFDHIGAKSFNIASAIRDRNWQQILLEIEQCEVVCANCHRRRTAMRGGWARVIAVDRARRRGTCDDGNAS